MFDRFPFSVPALILSLGLVVSTFVASSTMATIKASEQTIAVTGSAQKILTSDSAKWSVLISENTDVKGLKEGNDRMAHDLSVFKNYLKKNGIDDVSVTIAPITVENLTSGYDQGNQLVGYKLSQYVQVASSDIQKITQVAQAASSLLSGGTLITTTSLEYYYSKLSELKVDMLAEATQNAKVRAEKIAESAGSRLGALKGAEMGVMQVTPVNSTDVSDYGSYDTSSIEKQITAIVRATFAVR